MFIWCLMHGKVKTRAFLHSINACNEVIYGLYGLETENITHLFSDCKRIQGIWTFLESSTWYRIMPEFNVAIGL